MKKILYALPLVLSVTVSASAAESMRTWELDNGDRFEAALLDYQRSVAQLQLPDGTVKRVPARELSPSDRAFIHRQRKEARVERKDDARQERLSGPEFEIKMARQDRQRQASAQANTTTIVQGNDSWPVWGDLYRAYNGWGIPSYSPYYYPRYDGRCYDYDDRYYVLPQNQRVVVSPGT